MLSKRYIWILAILVAINFAYQYSQWGLITIKVRDTPLRDVVKSIEWQGWVKIYTNLSPDTLVTLYIDHVTMAEAMQKLTIAVNGSKSRSLAKGQVQWNLGFFVAPTSEQVRQEIRAFVSNAPGADDRIYNYPTSLLILSFDLPTSDPRLQSWKGITPEFLAAEARALSDKAGSAPSASEAKTAEDYLQGFAASSNIWILSPGSWSPQVSSPPPPAKSLIRAMRNFIDEANGAMVEGIVLRDGWGDNRKAPDFNWADRMSNAIEGLPPESRSTALKQLDIENKFRDEILMAPPEKVHELTVKHRADILLYSDIPLSPEMRAMRFKRIVAAHAAAQSH